jgi:hypothetical protein
MARDSRLLKLRAVGLAVWLACVCLIAFGGWSGSGSSSSPQKSFQNPRVPIPEPGLPWRQD